MENNMKQIRDQMLRYPKLRSLGYVTAGAAMVALGVSYYRSQNNLYRAFVLPVVHVLPPESGHNLAVWAFKHKIFPTAQTTDDVNLHTQFFGHLISNPIGIAAGFDKNGEAIEGLNEVGFGFVEIGSVTPNPQPGNPAPRLFRLENDRAIINRYGFNSDGHKKVVARVARVKNNENFHGIVGVNLGRNRRTKSTVEDYVKGVKAFGPVADYLVINVSSPNTRGLRDMQNKKRLEVLLEKVNQARDTLDSNKNVPILLKLSPDLSTNDVKDVCSVIQKNKFRVDGLIVANTTTSRENLEEVEVATQSGGLSGEPLRERSTQMIALVYHLTKGKVPIVGVGGVSSGQDAYQKIEAGASYIQFYTALVYHGPEVVAQIKNDLSQLVNDMGFESVQSVVGSNYRSYLPTD